ncbi:hypothetical protein V6N11_084148 [Hibiscus sabdariffa]|uniref:Uncharacterized protein n=2 Tax=Hibiscus sabdariffa TaxID=183260 RepID=A0ABR2DHQ5_9ROSI
MSVILKVWKRLVVTFFSIFVAFFFYLVATVVVMLIWNKHVFPTMMKSKNLIKGKVWLAISIFLIHYLEMEFNQIAFEWLVVKGSIIRMGLKKKGVKEE